MVHLPAGVQMMTTADIGSQHGLSLCTLAQAAEVYHPNGTLHSTECFTPRQRQHRACDMVFTLHHFLIGGKNRKCYT